MGFVDVNHHCDFFLEDWKFDGRDGIWFDYKHVERVLRHFAGAITPDFSTNQDFSKPWKTFNTYRMRAYGYWLGRLGHQVVNGVRWGTAETYAYCFEGIPRRPVVCIGTVASELKLVRNRPLFEKGLREMLRVLRPPRTWGEAVELHIGKQSSWFRRKHLKGSYTIDRVR